MTNHWTDVKNSALALIFSNPFENHVGTSRYLNMVKANGGKLITVDPRRTRTADSSNLYVRIRPGTDIAFVNGLVRYALNTAGVADDSYMLGKTDAGYLLNTGRTDYQRDGNNVAQKVADVATMKNNPDTVYNYLKSRVDSYTPDKVAAICGCTVSEFNAVCDEIKALADYNATKGGDEFGKKRMAILYAMGTTQHSKGSQNIRSYAVLQMVLGNMGKSGGGINAMRGIHNVQGSTDMALLRGILPGYQGVPAAGATYFAWQNGAFGGQKDYLSPSGVKDGISQLDYPHWQGWQQAGNTNLLHAYFHQTTTPGAADYNNGDSNKNFDLLPRDAGDDHRTMFEKMIAGTTKALICWGQNPAVTEANLARVKAGLKNLDLLVCVDLFENETAACDRKSDGVTYLLPAAAFVERPGTITTSGRWIQWRYQATPPKGGSKPDLEIMIRLAKALQTAGAFSYIETSDFQSANPGKSAFDVLYADSYGYDGVSDFQGAGETGYINKADEAYSKVYAEICKWPGSGGTVWIYGNSYTPSGAKYGTYLTAAAAAGATQITVAAHGNASEINTGTVLELGPLSNGELVTVASVSGSGPYTITLTAATTKSHAAGEQVTPRGWWSYQAWNQNNSKAILAKSRAWYDPFGNYVFPRFAFAWLVNRRVFYNYNKCNTTNTSGPGAGVHREHASVSGGNRYSPVYVTWCADNCQWRPVSAGGDGSCPAPMDARDLFVASNNAGRIYVHHASDSPPVGSGPYALDGYYRYRAYNKLAEPDGRTPKHWEPWETPYDGNSIDPITGLKRPNYKASYGTVGVGPGGYSVPVGSSKDYPLVLTTFRFTEHFQGGPTTRNIDWLCELKPVPVIEMNFYDAYNWGMYLTGQPIKSGDLVYLQSARQPGVNIGPFTAVVGSGFNATQPVGVGVVAVPWHWGTKFANQTSDTRPYSEGASANELTIDALDANTRMPETKACLVKISAVTHV